MTAQVTRAEANLLVLARSAVGLVPATEVHRLLASSMETPARLGPTARGLLADTLSRGVVLTLARQGGWYDVGGAPLWDRVSAPPLEFTGTLVRLFQWLLQTALVETRGAPLPQTRALTLAESIVVTSLMDRLRTSPFAGALSRQPVVREAPLVVLAHAAELASHGPLPVPDFDVATLGTAIEGLRALLARNWAAAEDAKALVADPSTLTRIGLAQQQVLEAFLAAVDLAGRRDLASFLVDAGAEVLRVPRTAEDRVRSLSVDATLRDRTEARRRAAAFFRALGQLRTWDQEHRSVRFIDDGYTQAQRLLVDWERLGDAGFSAAQQAASALEALPA